MLTAILLFGSAFAFAAFMTWLARNDSGTGPMLLALCLFASSAIAQPATQPVFTAAVWQAPHHLFHVWKARGINLIITDAPKPDGHDRQDYMIKAHAAGLRVWIGTSTQVADEQNFAGFVQPDEPENWNKVVKNPDGSFNWPATTAVYKRRYAELKAEKPDVLVFGNFNGGPLNSAREAGGNPRNPLIGTYREFVQGADILCSDFYLAPTGRDTARYPEFAAGTTGRLIALSNNRKPVWAYVDTVDHGDPHPDARHPTPEEIRAHAWLHICHGATGIVYFPLKVRGGFKWDNTTPENAAAITALNAELQVHAAYLLTGTRTLRSLTAATWKLADGSTLAVDAKHAGGKWAVGIVETKAVEDVAVLKAEIARLKSQIEAARDALRP